MQTRQFRSLAAARPLALLLCLAVSAKAFAAEQASPSDTSAGQAGPVSTVGCVTRRITGAGIPDYDLVVPQADTSDQSLAGKGYVKATCPSPAALAKFKAEICEVAKGNSAVQARTEQLLGLDARKLCEIATKAIPDTTTTVK